MKFLNFLKRKDFGSESGVAAIELAIALPVLLLILMGIINFGTAFYNYVSITNAAREGARWGSINLNLSPPLSVENVCPNTPANNPCKVAINAAANLINYSGTVVPTATGIVDSTTDPKIITVTVNFNFVGIGYFFQDLFGTLSATSKMYLEE